jgi:hypothetical protein
MLFMDGQLAPSMAGFITSNRVKSSMLFGHCRWQSGGWQLLTNLVMALITLSLAPMTN